MGIDECYCWVSVWLCERDRPDVETGEKCCPMRLTSWAVCSLAGSPCVKPRGLEEEAEAG